MNRKTVGIGVLAALVLAWATLQFGTGSLPGVGHGENPEVGLQADPNGKFFHVAVLAPLSGDSAASGRSVRLGVSAAAQAINAAGGILGKQVQLNIIDTKSTDTGTIAAARKLVSESTAAKVGLIIDGSDDNLARLVIAEIHNRTIPYFAVAAGRCKTSIDGRTPKPNLWGTGLTLQASVEPLLIHLADKLRAPEKEFRISYVSGEDNELRTTTKFVRTIAESLSFQTIEDSYYDQRITDYYTVIREVLAKQPDVLFINNPGTAGARFLEQAHKLGLDKEMTLTGLSTFAEEQPPLIAQSLDGAFTVSTYAPGMNTPENRRFTELFRQAGADKNEFPTALVTSAFNALNLAAAAFTKAGSDELIKFASAMENLEIALPTSADTTGTANSVGATGLMSKENHLLIQPFYAVRISKGQREIAEFLGDASHPKLEDCRVVIHDEE